MVNDGWNWLIMVEKEAHEWLRLKAEGPVLAGLLLVAIVFNQHQQHDTGGSNHTQWAAVPLSPQFTYDLVLFLHSCWEQWELPNHGGFRSRVCKGSRHIKTKQNWCCRMFIFKILVDVGWLSHRAACFPGWLQWPGDPWTKELQFLKIPNRQKCVFTLVGRYKHRLFWV